MVDGIAVLGGDPAPAVRRFLTVIYLGTLKAEPIGAQRDIV
jgi:hypothetical protein